LPQPRRRERHRNDEVWKLAYRAAQEVAKNRGDSKVAAVLESVDQCIDGKIVCEDCGHAIEAWRGM